MTETYIWLKTIKHMQFPPVKQSLILIDPAASRCLFPKHPSVDIQIEEQRRLHPKATCPALYAAHRRLFLLRRVQPAGKKKGATLVRIGQPQPKGEAVAGSATCAASLGWKRPAAAAGLLHAGHSPACPVCALSAPVPGTGSLAERAPVGPRAAGPVFFEARPSVCGLSRCQSDKVESVPGFCLSSTWLISFQQVFV